MNERAIAVGLISLALSGICFFVAAKVPALDSLALARGARKE